MDNLELTEAEVKELSRLPTEYWPCPLCIVTLMEAHALGTIHHLEAFEALRRSGLVEYFPLEEGRVLVTERGTAFIEMILATPLPEQKWIDPRSTRRPVAATGV